MIFLDTEKNSTVLHRYIFAVSSLIRSNGHNLERFYDLEGLKLLERIYQLDATLRQKIATLIRDILDHDMFSPNHFLSGQKLQELGYWTVKDINFWCDVSKSLDDSELASFLTREFGKCL